MRLKTKEKLGDYLIDISKLIFGGAILGSVINIPTLPKITLILVGFLLSLFLLIIGLLIFNKK